MKASLLKRIASLEDQANQSARPPLTLVDLSTLNTDELEAYWTGASNISTTPSPGYVHTIIVDIHEISRRDYQDHMDLDDEELEATERLREDEHRRQQNSERERTQMAAIALSGYILPPVPANAYSLDDDE